MTSKQTQSILEIYTAGGYSLKELDELFPDVDWMQAEIERRADAVDRPTLSQPSPAKIIITSMSTSSTSSVTYGLNSSWTFTTT